MRKQHMVGWAVGVLALVVLAAAGFAQSSGQPAGGAWLGVYSQELDQDLRDAMKFRGQGVLVNRVVEDSPADRAGLRKGDIIADVNQRSIGAPDQLADAIRSRSPGAQVTLRVWRDGQWRSLTARLAARTEDDVESRVERSLRRLDESRDSMEDRVIRILGSRRGRLGVRIEDLSAGLNDYFSVPGGRGALILEVLADTPAERAGLKTGDVITRVGGNDVSNGGDLVNELRDKEGKVSITYVRRGTTRTTEAELESAPRVRAPRGPRAFEWHDERGPVPRVEVFRDYLRSDRDDLKRDLEDLREEMKRLHDEMEDMRKR